MSTRFERALAHTLRFEGGFVDDPDDPGGATNMGISLRFLRATGEIDRFDVDADGDLDADDVRGLSRRDVGTIYRDYFWSPILDDVDSELLAAKIFDFGVNMGPRQSWRLVQEALNDNLPPEERLAVDGILGPKTRAAVFEASAIWPDQVVEDLEDHAVRFYYGIAERRPASRKYLFGWIRRAYDRA